MKFGNLLNALSAILCLIAVLLEIAILVFVKDLALYGEDNDAIDIAEYRAIQLRNLQNDRNQVDGEGGGRRDFSISNSN